MATPTRGRSVAGVVAAPRHRLPCESPFPCEGPFFARVATIADDAFLREPTTPATPVPGITNPAMRETLCQITRCVEAACGLQGCSAAQGGLNSVNLNYYPSGGGVGFHADDEFLFDGLRQHTVPPLLS